eukprot:CAMPEP_0194033910 /NCGR_PEP_ID=MMETSP0009_2-20130614/6392_1 /TAXON_ID=210454 /ORGANISM="Grammatophora oceanica, Strain CCMP 410" /LENGTH=639 /DNA_ID=CAMNT_0038674641 /DNA_START=31 /DNA_END=1950 /DNA_ORIENTATION=-
MGESTTTKSSHSSLESSLESSFTPTTKVPHHDHKSNNAYANTKTYIRGVNVGGWLMAERFITPYLFAVNSCHLQGSLCWYPGQMGAPSNLTLTSAVNAKNGTQVRGADTITEEPLYGYDPQTSYHTLCDPTICQPVLPVITKEPTDYHPQVSLAGTKDYPVDEWTLGETLRAAVGGLTTARRYMERHWDTFVVEQNFADLADAGVTHLRIPMSYWIRRDEEDYNVPQHANDDDPYISGGWPYFVRACGWARKYNLTVWPDLHGAPGSENGFDNSGHFLGRSSCSGWDQSPQNVQLTLDILTDLAEAIRAQGLDDVVTGFGILNEPFADCDADVLRNYYNQALSMLRSTLGEHVSVFVGDMFRGFRFNDGAFWIDAEEHHDTYLDSHPYHVFFEQGRAFTPRQHIAYVCRSNTGEVKECCYEDAPNNTVPSHGISRIIGEWSGAYDTLPTAMVPYLMKGISTFGQAPFINRTLSRERKDFLRHFVEAQMVAYEARDAGVSSGWLFWNFKMEGGAFAEWDFLRGVKEGWMPPIPEPHVASEDLYGSCYEIYNRTNDDYSLVVDEFPDPRTLDWTQWQGWDANDDFVMSDPNIPNAPYYGPPRPWYIRMLFPMMLAGLFVFVLRRWQTRKRRESVGYTELKV